MTDEPKEEKMTDEEKQEKMAEEYQMLNEDLQKTLKVLIYKQLQFRLTHKMDDVPGCLNFSADMEADFDYLRHLACDACCEICE